MIALLLSRPGSLRDGIDALLTANSQIDLIVHPSDAEAALDFCKRNMTELIILEIRPDDRDILNIVCELKTLCPQGYVLGLIQDENDRRPAEVAQVDLIMSVGTPAHKLKSSIEALTYSSLEESE